ncbi:MAG: CoA transferase [Deltaproteobacteria bacterium]|nr:CoA transferase [Deltaproteobacteria bacterium]MBW2085703.1 CoA transferase [Deltaproteobacteria bacterium]
MEVNPRLICINMPSYGRTGLYKDYVGWGDNAEPLTGHYWVRGYPDDDHPLHNTPMFHMDSTGGTMAAMAAIMALRRRKRTGQAGSGLPLQTCQKKRILRWMNERLIRKRNC